MTPLIMGLGPTELIIILVIVLVLFGGSRLAGIGKSSGKAIREFKEETDALRKDAATDSEATGAAGSQTSTTRAERDGEPIDAEIVDDQRRA